VRGWPDFGVWRGRSDMGSGGLKGTSVRWGSPEDEPRIAELLELNGMPRWVAFEERFVVAEKKGAVLAALRYRTASKKLLLGLLVVDPWAGERPLAVALYAGAVGLAREMGAGEVLARLVPYGHYPYEAGYCWWGREWWRHTTWPAESRTQLPTGGWRRRIALLGVLAVPFHRAFRG
jgi:hypothetical protein